ncbi:hypothetical protein GWK47_014258 [Chionoecetes opilio]|uniref:Uncharacterized protein n=1 Tax=Chionoecetes opilio TaxID=41210 RepID=A0A8J4XV76_CHIOP|nr:hypothetical protein GWK47_014258 [Chionoecetes opilio]
MAGRRAQTGVLLFLSLLCVPPARPHPTLHPHHAHSLLNSTTSSRGALMTAAAGGGPGAKEWSLKDTVARLDDLLQRHNDYNEVMLESGEEDDQLSRLLYNLQQADRVREGWYETEPTLPTLTDPPLDLASLYAGRGKQEHRLEATALSEGVPRALPHPDRKMKRSREVRFTLMHNPTSMEHAEKERKRRKRRKRRQKETSRFDKEQQTHN